MNIEVKNARQSKRLKLSADMEFNTISLVQLWEKCEDAKTYMERLSKRVAESGYSTKWEKLMEKSLSNVVDLSNETTDLLGKMGAFDAIKGTIKGTSYRSESRSSQRVEAKSSR